MSRFDFSFSQLSLICKYDTTELCGSVFVFDHLRKSGQRIFPMLIWLGVYAYCMYVYVCLTNILNSIFCNEGASWIKVTVLVKRRKISVTDFDGVGQRSS